MQDLQIDFDLSNEFGVEVDCLFKLETFEGFNWLAFNSFFDGNIILELIKLLQKAFVVLLYLLNVYLFERWK